MIFRRTSEFSRLAVKFEEQIQADKHPLIDAAYSMETLQSFLFAFFVFFVGATCVQSIAKRRAWHRKYREQSIDQGEIWRLGSGS